MLARGPAATAAVTLPPRARPSSGSVESVPHLRLHPYLRGGSPARVCFPESTPAICARHPCTSSVSTPSRRWHRGGNGTGFCPRSIIAG